MGVSENQHVVYPATLMPPYMGPHPQKTLDFASYVDGSISFFQKYRNDTLSKFSLPPCEWEMQSAEYGPQPKVVAGKVRRNINRDLIVPYNNISTIDAKRMAEVDELYKAVQIHRSQYKDRTGTSHPLMYFKSGDYDYQCAPGMTVSYMSRYPQNYVGYKLPVVLPLTYSRQKEIPKTTDLTLSGIYNQTSCIAYKR